MRLLGAIIDPQTRLGDIRIALKPDPALRPGAFARGSRWPSSKAERPVLPQTAVMSDSEGTYVLVVNAQEQGRAPRGARVGGTDRGRRHHHERASPVTSGS